MAHHYIRSPRALGDLKIPQKFGFWISLFKRFSTFIPLAKEDSSFGSKRLQVGSRGSGLLVGS